MTPTQKIKWLVLSALAGYAKTAPPPYPCANVDELYAAVERDGNLCDELRDAISLVRNSGEETGLGVAYRHSYDSRAVAKQLPDGSWVGWSYWHGGGKHGDPSSIPWMGDAYDVTSHEETRVVRVFNKTPQ